MRLQGWNVKAQSEWINARAARLLHTCTQTNHQRCTIIHWAFCIPMDNEEHLTHHCQALTSCRAPCRWGRGQSWRGSWGTSSAPTSGRASTCAAGRDSETGPPPARCPRPSWPPGSSRGRGCERRARSTALPPPPPDAAAAAAAAVGGCGSLGSSSAQPYRSLILEEERHADWDHADSGAVNPLMPACVFICFGN